MFFPLIVLRPQLVIHGVLASRILFNLRQSRETDSEIISRMFPLAHMHHRLSSGPTTIRDPTLVDPHDHDRVKDPYS
jgi:hypothetical protein